MEADRQVGPGAPHPQVDLSGRIAGAGSEELEFPPARRAQASLRRASRLGFEAVERWAVAR